MNEKDCRYTLDILSARHERAESKLWAIIAAQTAAIVLLAALWRRKRERSI